MRKVSDVHNRGVPDYQLHESDDAIDRLYETAAMWQNTGEQQIYDRIRRLEQQLQQDKDNTRNNANRMLSTYRLI